MIRGRPLARLTLGAAIFSLGLLAPDRLMAQGVEYIKSHYTKYEYRIPMRDGVRLFTSVNIPKDQTQRYPIMLLRTPYSVQPYGADAYFSDLGPSPLFGTEGYIFVYQDVRGRWMSEGEFVNMRPHRPQKMSPQEIDESTDTFDTIDWLIKRLPNHNGRVGMWGISYPGFYTAAGMIDAHPALKAASPQAPVTDWFTGDDWHHNGALQLNHAFNFMSSFGHPRPLPTKKSRERFDHGTPDGYSFFLRMGPLANADARYFKDDVPFWNEMMQHGTFDEFWKAHNLRPHLKNIKPAVMTVGGWFDAENLFGALETYRNVEASSPGATNVLVMGPWRHGGWRGDDGSKLGPVPFSSKTSEYFREKIEFPFFQYYLKGKGSPSFPEAWVFETGTNQWKTYDVWPPRNVQRRSLFLQAGGGLAFDAPAGPVDSAFDEYVSDPARPVEYIDQIENRMTADYMVQDQRFASRRPDVLVYQGAELTTDVTIAGPILARLFVSTSGTDSDWVVKLIDVYPDDYSGSGAGESSPKFGGFQQLVRGDVMRGKFRNSLEKPEPFSPDQPTAVNFALQDVAHTFRAGHKIMVQIQSTWFPLIDRNPQKFIDIYNAKESDFQKATQRVYRNSEKPSHLELLEVPR
ncbi:MAG: CocE/NonD family hydrolase [Isosphaerales bacterium]